MITIAHASGLHPVASLADLHQQVAEGQDVWLDNCDATSRIGGAVLEDLGMDAADVTWLQQRGVL